MALLNFLRHGEIGVCPQLFIIEDGQIVYEGTTAKLEADDGIIERFLGLDIEA